MNNCVDLKDAELEQVSGGVGRAWLRANPLDEAKKVRLEQLIKAKEEAAEAQCKAKL